jgi:trimeric autotransporter adhesin
MLAPVLPPGSGFVSIPGSTPFNGGTITNALVISGVSNGTSLSIVGATHTGSDAHSDFSIATAWNTSAPITALDVNVTNTASGAGSLLANLRVGGSSQFSVDLSGGLLLAGNFVLSPSLGGQSMSIGINARGFGAQSIAIGYNSYASNYYDIAIGSYTAVTGNQACALGYSATSNFDYSVAIGSQAVCNAPNQCMVGSSGLPINIATWGAISLYNSGFSVGFAAPTLAASTTWTLPAADSTGTQFLQSNGSGVLSWGTPAGSVTSIAGTAGQITASASTGAVTLSLPASITKALTFTGGSGATLLTIPATGVPSIGSAANNGLILVGTFGNAGLSCGGANNWIFDSLAETNFGGFCVSQSGAAGTALQSPQNVSNLGLVNNASWGFGVALDATSTIQGTVPVGGGGNVVPVFYNGTSWQILGGAGNSKSADLSAQSATVASVVTTTAPNDGSAHQYTVGAYTAITAISAGTLTLTITFTDENSTSRTITYFPMGLTSAGLTSTGFTAFSPATIRAKANTAITLVSTFTGVSITYDVGGNIQRVN